MQLDAPNDSGPQGLEKCTAPDCDGRQHCGTRPRRRERPGRGPLVAAHRDAPALRARRQRGPYSPCAPLPPLPHACPASRRARARAGVPQPPRLKARLRAVSWTRGRGLASTAPPPGLSPSCRARATAPRRRMSLRSSSRCHRTPTACRSHDSVLRCSWSSARSMWTRSRPGCRWWRTGSPGAPPPRATGGSTRACRARCGRRPPGPRAGARASGKGPPDPR
mmetsp:Transcript_94617/g.276574  ORF Transcript_94617/g.276574 Transcript_94617/m.276574 type:complete len:222 (+) Transcript_94617:36-701(+)